MKVSQFISNYDINVIEALDKIDKCGYGVLYIVNESKQLIGAVSDGDIRRWIIQTNDLNAGVVQFMNKSPKFVFEHEQDKACELRTKYPISSVPVLNSNREIINVIVFEKSSEALAENKCTKSTDIPCVIMAGGKGTRLYPYTKILPKPLIPIGETPILERIIQKYVDAGVNHFYLTVNYKKNMIRSYFDDVDANYSIEYVEEDKPLGTAGSIKLLPGQLDKPLFVTNCDAIIMADYMDIYDYHIKSGNVITMVTALKNFTVPYGVIRSGANGELKDMEEKPRLSYFINTGMYVISPEVINMIPDDVMFHMTHLIEKVMETGQRVGTYPISEDSFLDMGEFGEMRRMEEKLNIVSDELI